MVHQNKKYAIFVSLILFLLSLSVVSEFLSFNLGVNLKFYHILTLILLPYLFIIKVKKQVYFYIFIFFILVMYLSLNTFFSTNISISTKAFIYRVYSIFSIFIILSFLIHNKISIERILNYLYFVILLSVIFAYLQLIMYIFFQHELYIILPYQTYDFKFQILGIFPRVFGFMNGPSEFAIITSMIIPFIMYRFFKYKHNYEFIILLLFTVIVIISLSRTGYLVLGSAYLLSYIYYFKNKRIQLYAVLFLILFTYIIFFTEVGELLLWRLFGDDGFTQSSTDGHKMYAIAAIQSFFDNFLVGTGIGTFQDYVQQHIFFNNKEAMTHSVYLEFISEQGIIGTLINMFIISIILYNLFKNNYVYGNIFLLFLIGNTTYHIYNFAISYYLYAIFIYIITYKGFKNENTILCKT
jgi:hypothetical protein